MNLSFVLILSIKRYVVEQDYLIPLLNNLTEKPLQ